MRPPIYYGTRTILYLHEGEYALGPNRTRIKMGIANKKKEQVDHKIFAV